MRPAHYLKEFKANQIPHECVWVDTETDPEIISPGLERHILREGMAAHQRITSPGKWTNTKWLEFTEKETFFCWLEERIRPNKKLYVFAHNWAYDFPVLDGFSQMRKLGYTLVSAVIESPPVILTYKKDKVTIQFVDTLNIWRTSLKDIGDKIGLPKLEMPNKNATKESWLAYNKRDVEIIQRATLEWFTYLKVNDLGGFANTLAAQALRTFKHRFMAHEILIDADEDALSLAREAFKGGRTECFYLGVAKEEIIKIDINSMYPAIMFESPMPTKLIGYYDNVSLKELSRYIEGTCVVAKVHINTDEPVYGIQQDGKLIFPIGTFVVSLTTPEIKYALEHNHIIGVESMALYHEAEIFRYFVHHFYTMRLEQIESGDLVGAYNTKILMNSLYGKFGQSGRRYDRIDNIDNDEIKQWIYYDTESKQTYNFRQYGGIVEQFVNEGESRDSHPAIAAHVTGYGRIKLWQDIKTAGLENLYYCDTDSIWINQNGYNNIKHLIDGSKLGKYKLEGKTNNCIIHGPKDYVWDGKATLKGIKSRARKLSDNKYEQEHFSTLKGLLRNKTLDAPLIKTQTKELYRAYNKGIVLDSGRVLPFDFINGEVNTG